jgi:hypothetical protein
MQTALLVAFLNAVLQFFPALRRDGAGKIFADTVPVFDGFSEGHFFSPFQKNSFLKKCLGSYFFMLLCVFNHISYKCQETGGPLANCAARGLLFLRKQFHSPQSRIGMDGPADESADDLPESGYGEDVRAFVNNVPQSGYGEDMRAFVNIVPQSGYGKDMRAFVNIVP